MGRIVAIDYGAKRTGLAWTDELQLIATGLGSFDTKVIGDKLLQLVKDNEIEGFVLGYPTRLDGSDTHITAAVRDFEKWMQAQFSEQTIYFWDERFSSKEAQRAMIQGGVKKKKRREKHLINQISATLILQSFLSNRTD